VSDANIRLFATVYVLLSRKLSPATTPTVAGFSFVRPRWWETATLADHLGQTSLTVVLRQKRQLVTPITLQNQDQSYLPCDGGVDYAQVYDVKDHHGFGAASNRINCRNDRRFC
jgi:hypothetical protein